MRRLLVIVLLLFAAFAAQAGSLFRTVDSYSNTPANMDPGPNCERWYGDGRQGTLFAGDKANTVGARYACGAPFGVVVTIVGCAEPAVQQPDNTCKIPDEPDACTLTLSKSKTTNFTVCYARGGSSITDCATPLSYPNTGQSVCLNGCKWGVGDPVAAFKSETVTSTGLYRLSVDMKTAGLGQDCTTAPDDTGNGSASPQAVTPECVGSLGQVNGKPYCAGTATNPVSNDKPANLPIPPTSGNPAAGDKPDTGEGSGTGGAGRTPSAGNGGSAGGPASAAGTGSTGDVTGGTVTKPTDGKEQANCGAPGQPKCAIDETGTPTVTSGKFDSAADAYKNAMDTNRGTMAGTADKGYFNGWSSFWAAPPVASCQAFVLPADKGSIDPCNVVDGVRSVMGYIWALTAMWLCIGMVTRTIRGGE